MHIRARARGHIDLHNCRPYKWEYLAESRPSLGRVFCIHYFVLRDRATYDVNFHWVRICVNDARGTRIRGRAE